MGRTRPDRRKATCEAQKEHKCNVPKLPKEVEIILGSSHDLRTEKEDRRVSHCYRQESV